MVPERRAATARLVTAQEAACQSARRHNVAVVRETMAARGGRQEEEEDQERATSAMARASQRHNQYPLPSFIDYEDAERRQILEDRLRHRQQASNRPTVTPMAELAHPPIVLTPPARSSSGSNSSCICRMSSGLYST
jgi:hypothetical protein